MSPREFAAAVLALFLSVISVVASAGFHTVSPWWIATVTAWLTSDARQLVIRAGRRAGKSSTLMLAAVVWALVYPVSAIPLGDIGVVALISVDRREAEGRLHTIRALLRALHVPHEPSGDSILLTGRPIKFQVFTASIAGVSGFTCILAICDEVALWADRETGANPASRVLETLRPTMATQPLARIVLSSSPLSTVDAHHEAFERGNTDFQMVAFAETWIANPNVSEEETHRLEPDPRAWARNFAARPQAAALAAFDSEAIARAFEPRNLDGLGRAQRVCIIDPSSGRKDAFTFALCGWVTADDSDKYQRLSNGDYSRHPWGERVIRAGWKPKPFKPALVFDSVDGQEGKFWASLPADEVIHKIASIAKGKGATVVHSDQREAFALEALVRREGLKFVSHDYTATSKPRAVEHVRRWLRDGVLALPNHPKLRAELEAFEERIAPTGAFTFGARGSGHDDFVALLLTAALVDLAGMLPGSSLRGRQEDSDSRTHLNDPYFWGVCPCDECRNPIDEALNDIADEWRAQHPR